MAHCVERVDPFPGSTLPERVVALDLSTLERRLRELAVVDADPVAASRAAVAIVLAQEAGTTRLLLIRRAERAEDPWSGHIAFPGGRETPDDASLLGTAMRETREETGIDLVRSARVIGRLPDAAAFPRGNRLDLPIAPFVFTTTSEPSVRSSEETAEIFWTDVDPLACGEADTMAHIIDGVSVELAALERTSWGLTYRILRDLLRLPVDDSIQ